LTGAKGSSDEQRIDKWLYFARVLKSRSQAAKLISEGHVRVNGLRVAAVAKPVKPGDVLTIALEKEVRILRVVLPGIRRESYGLAKTLFKELTPSKTDPGYSSRRTD
jgi:ribosome-associated heat shock protein Hsp15